MGRRTVVLVVALALAAISAVAIWAFLQAAEDEAREGLIEVPAYRAVELIPRGAVGDDVIELFEESTELDGLLPATAIQTQAQLEATLRGRISLGPISAGQVVTGDLWGDPALETVGLSDLIEPGFQAISIRPDEVRGVGGFVRPGDRVNVIASTEVNLGLIRSALRTPAARSVFFPGLQARLGLADEEMVQLAEALPETRRFTEFVLQDLLVLAVGSDTAPTAPPADDEEAQVVGARIVTLQIDAEQAEKLVFVQEYMTSWLTLVPPGFEPEDTDGAEIEDIIDLPEQLIAELRGLGFLAAPGS